VALLHNFATPGQASGIMREVQIWENNFTGSYLQEQEYNEIMKANELYMKLCEKD
jgi:hypothetical protein